MPPSAPRLLAACAVFACILLNPAPASAQDLGHKIPGAVGVDAGIQSRPGIYVADRFVYYSAERARDRNGLLLPVKGLDLDAVGNAVGIQGTLHIPRGPYVSASFALPLARVSLNSDDPRASVDRFGLGDVYVMPLKLGLQRPHLDLVTSYGLYIPTGRFEPRGGKGVGRGHWTHQFSLGGAVFFDTQRRARASALASYDLNLRKRNIDITRGDTVLIQGGLGVTLFQFLDVGIAGYALWQVRDDRGADLPEPLTGARDRVYGLGPEVSVRIPVLRSKVGARFEWDLYAQTRPQGRVLVLSVDVAAWQPRSK